MTLKKDIDEAVDPKLEKYVSSLKEPARRTKQALRITLEKSVKRFQDQADKSVSEKEKYLFQRKRDRISNDLAVLKILSEDDIIIYGLLMLNKIMPIASNPRIPREERMKARVAAHKPLFTHLSRLKRKLSQSQETGSESENEQESSRTTPNKITFNNTIVKMRKDVRRAKVHIIHKLTRNIKKLRTAKGKEEKVAKLQKKAERLHKKVIHIKELHEDEVSKFALSTTQNLSQLSTDIKAPTASQALATLAIHEFVAAHVRDFKEKYPDGQKVVPNLLKRKSKKRKLNLETKDNGKNSSELSQVNSESDNDHSESGNEEQSENEEKSENEEENDDSERNGDEEESDAQVNGRTLDKNDEENLSDDMSSASENEFRSVINKNKENSKKNMPAGDSRVKSKAIVSKKVSKSKERIKATSPSPLHFADKTVEDKPQVIDPFFVTATNEEYVTSQVPLSSETNSSIGKKDNFEPKTSGRFSKFDHKNKWERSGSEGKYGKFNRFQDTVPYKKPLMSSFGKDSVSTRTDKLVFGNRKERRKALKQPQIEEKVEKLHPSWEAKKKQSSIIPFQGKKVKFD